MAQYSDTSPPEKPSPMDKAIQEQLKGGRYQFTDEEKRVLRECRVESFWYNSLPISALSGISTHILVTRGFLSPSKRFGSIPKVAFASMCGYALGKMLYVTKCREKFLKLENSPFAEMMRRGASGMPRGAGFGGLPVPGFGGDSSGESEAVGDKPIDYDTPWRGGHDQRLNIDIDTSQVKGIDNTFDSDLTINAENLPARPETTTTYDELRKRSREKHSQQYTQVLPGHFQPKAPPMGPGPKSDVDQQGAARPKRQQPPQEEFSLGSRSRGRMVNKYGDAMEKE